MLLMRAVLNPYVLLLPCLGSSEQTRKDPAMNESATRHLRRSLESVLDWQVARDVADKPYTCVLLLNPVECIGLMLRMLCRRNTHTEYLGYATPSILVRGR